MLDTDPNVSPKVVPRMQKHPLTKHQMEERVRNREDPKLRRTTLRSAELERQPIGSGRGIKI